MRTTTLRSGVPGNLRDRHSAPPVTKPTGLLPALSVDPPKKPTTPTVGKPLGSGLGGLNKLGSSIAGALKNSSARTPVAAGGAAGSTGDK
jgi:hypothetical protein